ncbi:S8 family serine peptidase [Amycolatopsis umgeniensis]|uniref:Subtilisin family serine protease n=1 Tax=Amycolatopsis umgeniensis TaxID=336628 RepID=A0A841BD67_9PSEU|nr:S8 family peptidase [Amycolatopsis umgeniensis]MBB5857257.1 subtilisin family serine protease [Amycolatopsis umgeniensis]
MRRRAHVLAGLLLVTVLGVTSAQVAQAAPGQPPPENAATPGPRTLTLITGDRITVRERQGEAPTLSVQPGPGRERMGFQRTQDKNGWSVFPADALPLVAKGVLDERLFRVDRLLADGYDDSARPTLPLIVQQDGAVSGAGATTVRRLDSVGATAFAQPKDRAGEFWATLTGPRAASVRKVWLDRKVKANLDRSVPQIGAPEAWRSGFTGKDVKVAVLDTGIDAHHPDLAGKVVAAKDFSGGEDPTDRHGHGTHVASTILGSGSASAGRLKGVAPDAGLLAAKVLGDDGSGGWSEIISGMEWAVAQGAKVINLSLGGDDDEGVDPLEAAVNRLTKDNGVLFVIAAGNDGDRGAGTVGSPGSADEALTVGAVDRADALASFSGKGPRRGDNAVKPEITAPGVGIVAAKAGGDYQPMSGTSMATPHVAGAAALLVQQHPDWRPEQIKAGLTGSAKPAEGLTVFQQGAGRTDVAKAVEQRVNTDVTTVAFGTVPVDDPKPRTREITYRNSGEQPVELDLRLDVRDENGKPAVDGLFTVDRPKVTVPAGGTATAAITVNPGQKPRAAYGGTLLATSADVTVRSLIGADLQREVFSADVKLFDRKGDKANGIVFVTNLDSGEAKVLSAEGGGGPIRLPQGRYLFVSEISETTGTSLVTEPGFVLDRDREVVLDGRLAKPVTVRTDREGASSNGQIIAFSERVAGRGSASYSWYQPRLFHDEQYAYVAPTRTVVADFDFLVTTMLSKQTGEGRSENSPYLYNLQFPANGRVPDVSAYRVRDHELAKVNATYAGTGRQWGNLHVLPSPYDNESDLGDAWFLTAQAELPSTREEFYSTGKIRWLKRLFVDRVATNGTWSDTQETAAGVEYRAGQRSKEDWNRAVVGPTLAKLTKTVRDGDTVSLLLPLLAAGGDHASLSFVEGTTRLTRDGKEIGSVPRVPGHLWPNNSPVTFTVPPEAGEYTLTIDAKRPEGTNAELSANVVTSWKFRSQRAEGEKPLPLMALRAAPSLGPANDAWRLLPLVVPIEVQRSAGMTGTIRQVTAEASFDGGKNWHRQPVVGSGAHRQAFVVAPLFSSSPFVSLRLSATESGGGSVTQTIVNAYRLR